jgi:hypothetical protein
LRVHRRRLSIEDLEDCYSQATLELLLAVRRGRVFLSPQHIANALDQRLRSRIQDRRRALAGRSAIEAGLAAALPLGAREHDGVEPPDVRADVEQLVHVRLQLRLLAKAAERLTADQRLALRSQLDEANRWELCRRQGWSPEKCRKVAQRARARLHGLLNDCPVSRGTVG